jgi:hypothetical protein
MFHLDVPVNATALRRSCENPTSQAHTRYDCFAVPRGGKRHPGELSAVSLKSRAVRSLKVLKRCPCHAPLCMFDLAEPDYCAHEPNLHAASHRLSVSGQINPRSWGCEAKYIAKYIRRSQKALKTLYHRVVFTSSSDDREHAVGTGEFIPEPVNPEFVEMIIEWPGGRSK